MRLLNILFLLAFSLQAQAKSLMDRTSIKGLSAGQKLVAHKLIANIENVLPDTLLRTLNTKTTIHFSKINKTAFQEVKCVSSENTTQPFVYGRYNRFNNSITMEIELLDIYQDSENIQFSCKHKNLKAQIESSLIHEIFHAYDASPFEKQSLYKGCPNFRNISNSSNSMSPSSSKNLSLRCKGLYKHYKRKNKISDSKIFKNIAFWREGGNRANVTDVYENHSPIEFSAVNFEYFLLDKEYKCRRPLLYNFFSEEFGHRPHQNFECQNIKQVLINHDVVKELRELDANRVYKVQYLLASKGDSLMSGFGHSMIRFVVCAPEHIDPITQELVPATPYGPECLGDIDHHIVASFRANIDEMNINSMKGMTGSYPSVLYMLPMKGVMYEYNKQELRDLFAFDIKLTEEQKSKLIAQVMTTHWGYKGSYKFFSANCATETLSLIQSVFNNIEFHNNESIRPYGVLSKLQDLGLIDKNFTKDDGFKDLESLNVFKSNEFYLSIALKNIREGNVNRKILVSYLEESSSTHTAILEGLLQQDIRTLTLEEKLLLRKELASFIILEEQSLIMYVKKFLEEALKVVTDLIKQKKVDVNLDEFVKELSQSQHAFLNSRYGIPQEYEFLGTQEKLKDVETDIKEVIAPYMDAVDPYIEKYKNEAKTKEDNINRAKESLKLLKISITNSL